VARLVGQRLAEQWGQPVVIENRPGAGQAIGAEAVAKAPADGYTLFASSDSTFVANPHLYSKLPYDALRDFTPIVVLCRISPVMAVHPSLPARNVRELIALAKARPGALSYGSFGSGTYAHLSMEEFKQRTGTDIVHVPYKGSAPAVSDLVAGQISVLLSGLGSVGPYEKAGRLRIIAAATPRRLAALPSLPTVAESGVPGWETGAWFGLFGPASLPREITAKIHADANRAVDLPETKASYLRLTLEPVRMSPEEMAQYIRTELERWGRLIRATGARVD
jgi:tripartite-type tricarboxylate transporter receptor subunit TctC